MLCHLSTAIHGMCFTCPGCWSFSARHEMVTVFSLARFDQVADGSRSQLKDVKAIKMALFGTRPWSSCEYIRAHLTI